MIIVRDVFQAKYGKGGELVALMKEVQDMVPEAKSARLMTDLSGSFFTVVNEFEFASLGDWERFSDQLFSRPEFGAWFSRMQPLVESGRREFYRVEA